MNRIPIIISKAALLAGIISSVSTASAVGLSSDSATLLGKSYFGATLDYVDTHKASLRGAKGPSLFINQPVAENIDVSAEYSYDYARIRPTSRKMKDHDFFTDGTYIFKRQGAQPYVRGGFGRSLVYVPGPNQHASLYRAEAGVELPLGRAASLTPYVRYTDGFRSRVNDTFEGGVLTHVPLSHNVSLIARVTRSNDKNNAFSVGMVFPFRR